MSSPLFSVRDLCKAYNGNRVLDHLSFDVFTGESFVILGRSGTGKSVTLRHLNGLEKPDSGSVSFEGTEITDLGEHDLFPYRRRIAMLFQSGALFDSMNVFDNIAFPLRRHGGREEDDIARIVEETLHQVELPEVAAKMPSELSGGMRKRVALARSLALDPQVILFDEPTTGLDPMTSASIAQLIRATRQRSRTTAVVVTHDLVLTRTVATRIAFLDQGRFRFVGTWEEAEASTDPLLSGFLASRSEEEPG